MQSGFKALVAALCLFLALPAWAGSIQIKGSTTVLPIAQKCAEAFMKANPDIAISISGGGSGNGIKALIDGTTDIADASRFIKGKEVKRAVENGRYPVPFSVAYDCIVPIVHPSNNVANLTLDQLKGIYKGDITNWKEVGGPDQNIVVISRDTSSGTYEVWEKKVMSKERVYNRAQLQASNGAVAQTVAKNKRAIGYVGFGYLNKEIKGLTVNGIEGNPSTTLSGAFPISRALFMFTQGWPKGDTAKFINFVLNPKTGQPLVEAAGFVPLY
ncbi:phosphate ABC transporter substrate-binding protein [Desulfoplanes sp.]